MGSPTAPYIVIIYYNTCSRHGKSHDTNTGKSHDTNTGKSHDTKTGKNDKILCQYSHTAIRPHL